MSWFVVSQKSKDDVNFTQDRIYLEVTLFLSAKKLTNYFAPLCSKQTLQIHIACHTVVTTDG